MTPKDVDTLLNPYTTSEEIRDELRAMILKASAREPRSVQEEIGPSEIGTPCDRQLAYKIAGVPKVHVTDPLPSIIGTAVHKLLEGYAAGANDEVLQYLTENEVTVAAGLVGHSDLLMLQRRAVVDWKVLGQTSFRDLVRNGPGPQYRIQAHLYGKGFAAQGYSVDTVAIAALPKTGWLRDMHVWSEPYSEALALKAIERYYKVIEVLDELQATTNPELFWAFTTHAGGKCDWCPFFSPNAKLPGATCPGHSDEGML